MQAQVVKEKNIVKENRHENSGLIDFNGYYDTREYGEMTINILANMDHRIQYFSLTNFSSTTPSADLSGYYSEQNIRWNPIKKLPLDITSQWVIRAGSGNDDLRLSLIHI